MADLDKMFAAMADVSAEDSTCDYIIDEDLRVIAIPERGVVLGVEGDKDVTRIRFRMVARQRPEPVRSAHQLRECERRQELLHRGEQVP